MAASVSVPGLAANSVAKIGRYFNLVSVVPAFVLVSFTALLAASGALDGGPSLTLAVERIGSWGFSQWAVIGAVTIAIAFLLHPLQFAMVQLLEGYWGVSAIALEARRARSEVHLSKVFRLADLADEESDPVAASEAERLLMAYPADYGHIMPTRLGNALKALELRAGSQYGLNSVITAPRLLSIIPSEYASYIDDRRNQMDAGVRVCLTLVAATVISIYFMWSNGFWLFLALGTYVSAYLAYRGAVAAAAEYGSAFDVAVDLYRFDLYEQLHVSLPATTDEERTTNLMLMDLLSHDHDVTLQYAHKSKASSQSL